MFQKEEKKTTKKRTKERYHLSATDYLCPLLLYRNKPVGIPHHSIQTLWLKQLKFKLKLWWKVCGLAETYFDNLSDAISAKVELGRTVDRLN